MTQPNQAFYDRALSAYNDRLGPLVARLRSMNALVLVLGVADLALVALVAFMAFLLATRPVEVVQVPVQGGAAVSHTSTVAGVSSGSLSERDRVLVEQALSTYVKDLKTVSSDPELIVQSISRAQGMSAPPVVRYVKDYFRVEDSLSPTSPFSILGTSRVTVDVKTVHRITEKSYRVAWTETYKRADSGQLERVERWTSTVTFALRKPSEMPASWNKLDNPLALIVTGLEWSKE